MGEKSASGFEDLIGPPQFLVLALQLLEAVALGGCQAFALTSIDLVALDQSSKVCGTQPIFGAMDSTATHSDG